MQNQSELTCVSCENTFDPAPHGGFCPECDTPHPDFGRPDGGEDDGSPGPDEAEEAEIQEAVEDDAADDDSEEIELDDADETEDGDAEDAELDEDDETEDDAAEEVELDEDDAAEDDATEDDAAEEVELDEADVEEITECDSCGAEVDSSVSFCPDCGADLDADEDEDEDEDEEEELSVCPDCGYEIDGESFCPDCGTDLDAVRDRLGDGEVAGGVTLVVDGESYTFHDGDTFGRQEEDWLEALVRASGGREEVKYISSDHLEFSVEDDGVYVSDVSTNGTLLNGEDLEGGRAELEDGDELELAGRATIQVEL